MAPTETLAEQHFATLQKLMPGELVQAALLTGSTPAGRRADLLGKLASGELKLLVGTHALIEEAVEFDRLAVAVVDEQHRFGVNQRRALDRKAPDGPRAARAAHDRDADPAHARAHRLRRPRRHRPARAARRAGGRSRPTWAPPTPSAPAPTSASARSSTPAARRSSSARWSRSPRCCRRAPPRPSTSGCEAGELKDYRVVLLHGQMRPREKQEAMAAFAAGGADVLVATTVIEVGIDVPNATVMLVEDAERYGISPAAPAARADRPRRARVAVPAVRAQGVAPPARDGRAPRRLRAGRDRPRAARRGGDARRPPVRPAGLPLRPPAGGRRAARARPPMRAREILDDDPELERPSTCCSRTRSSTAFGADALEPIPA